MAEKNYRASTGVDSFYYAVLDDTDTVVGTPERVKFLQTITVDMPQEPTRAYGDNRVAEIAINNGNVSVTSAFHKIPIEDRVVLFGLEQTEEGLTGYGSNDNPPYAACVFAKTHEDGSTEWVGLPKGMFLRNNIAGETKADSTTFGSDEITAEFMDREVNGFTDEMSVITGYDEKGSTTARDALFTAIFGVPHPDSAAV